MDNDRTIIYWIIAIIVILALAGGSDDSSYDGCYDADPTQWTEMVCDYEE